MTSCAVPDCPTRPPDLWPLCEEHLGQADPSLLGRALRHGNRTEATLIALEWVRRDRMTLEDEALAVTRRAELKQFVERLEAWHEYRSDWDW